MDVIDRINCKEIEKDYVIESLEEVIRSLKKQNKKELKNICIMISNDVNNTIVNW